MKWSKDVTYKIDRHQRAKNGKLELSVTKSKLRSADKNPWFYNVTIIAMGSVMGVARCESKAKAFAEMTGRMLVRIYGK